MKITKEELIHLLAEKVMLKEQVLPPQLGKSHTKTTGMKCNYGAVFTGHSWFCNKCGYYEDFAPLEDANHALQVLEAYSSIYSYNLGRDQLGHYCWLYDMKSVRHAKNLNHAICLAVAEAHTGNKYELED